MCLLMPRPSGLHDRLEVGMSRPKTEPSATQCRVSNEHGWITFAPWGKANGKVLSRLDFDGIKDLFHRIAVASPQIDCSALAPAK
jgi:hypothetical protein